ncbi:NAD(P)H-dependent oxidoreductase [Flavobacterium silvaticum]|uniref:NAD(P)H-dependent oxidoreductase n=1 Tax=Flavobacterium silvaticum TaxID=1852020 RepID=A0A972FJW6_9FLAO|nr:NAD(P)H-dependent oxidoreductase [Flavobacterium silvaticum]NMH27399.1 NAD(P)H-dependent oxidoreductase [Flavobacterium silvaticum]
MKNILVILGHPSENSFCKALLDAYMAGAEKMGAHCQAIYISRLTFNVNLADGYRSGETLQLEEDLAKSQELIKWADHVVMAFPNWWGYMPAITKGFIDRMFLPGFAFKNHSGKNFPEQLLKGKSMRVFVTMDTPKFWFYLVHRASLYRILKKVVFGYVGFKPIGFSTFGFMRKTTDKQRKKWLKKVELLGTQFK